MHQTIGLIKITTSVIFIIGSIKDNPKTAAILGSLLIPGAGSALSGSLGSAGTAIGNVGSNILGSLGNIGSAISSGLGTVGEFILPGADKIGLFGNVSNLLGGGLHLVLKDKEIF